MAATREDALEYIKNMTLLEASEFVKLLEETFGVSAAGAAVAAAPAAAAGGDRAPGGAAGRAKGGGGGAGVGRRQEQNPTPDPRHPSPILDSGAAGRLR